VQLNFRLLLVTRNMSGNVAHDLSGLNEYHGHSGGDPHDTDKIATGDSDYEV